jgi:hypothetical protein
LFFASHRNSTHANVLFYARMKRDPTAPALGSALEQPCWLRLRAHCSFQALGERAHLDIACREQDFWSSLLAHLRACSPPLRHLQVAAARRHCRSNHFAPLSAALIPLTLCMCSCFSPSQRFKLHFDTTGRLRTTVLSARSSMTVVLVVGAAQRHAPAAAGVKLFGTSVKWIRCEPTLYPPHLRGCRARPRATMLPHGWPAAQPP